MFAEVVMSKLGISLVCKVTKVGIMPPKVDIRFRQNLTLSVAYRAYGDLSL